MNGFITLACVRSASMKFGERTSSSVYLLSAGLSIQVQRFGLMGGILGHQFWDSLFLNPVMFQEHPLHVKKVF